METTRPPGFPGNPPARMPRAPTPARSPPPRPLSSDDVAFRPTQDVGPRNQCISGLNHAAYGLPVNASRPGSPQAHASLGSGWRPTLAGWDWIPTGFRIRFRRLRHVILSPLTGLSRHTRWCTTRRGTRKRQLSGTSASKAVGRGRGDWTVARVETRTPSWPAGPRRLRLAHRRQCKRRWCHRRHPRSRWRPLRLRTRRDRCPSWRHRWSTR